MSTQWAQLYHLPQDWRPFVRGFAREVTLDAGLVNLAPTHSYLARIAMERIAVEILQYQHVPQALLLQHFGSLSPHPTLLWKFSKIKLRINSYYHLDKTLI